MKNINIYQFYEDNYVSLQDYIQLQSNWNSLREWLEARKNLYNSSIVDEYKIILDKMNELEGVDNE